jgi:DNA-binding LacI/PurR family transcriptional regulator
MYMSKKITLEDIAKESGLSISTVSRVLSGSGNTTSSRAKRIFEAAQKLNYPVSSQITPLSMRTSINVALVVKHYEGEFFASLFEGFDKAMVDSKIKVNLISVSHTFSSPDVLALYLAHSQFDAAIIFLPDYSPSDYAHIIELLPPNFPIVSIAPIANPVLDTITFDNYRGGHLVARHFEERGHKQLGIVMGPGNKSEAMLRKNGYLDYIHQSQNMSMMWEYTGDYSVEEGKAAYLHYKHAAIKPEAIFFCNDAMSIGFAQSAIRDGIKLPEQLALAGYDDLPICMLYTPTITSVHTPYDLLGRKTLELILDRLRDKKGIHHTGYTSLVPVSLSIRESSGIDNHC